MAQPARGVRGDHVKLNSRPSKLLEVKTPEECYAKAR